MGNSMKIKGFMGILSALGILLVLIGISDIRKAAKCKQWPPAQAIILDSSMRDLPVPSKKTSDILTPDIVYEYKVANGEVYFSNQIGYFANTIFPAGSDNYYAGSYQELTTFLEKYPVGKQIQIFYNPKAYNEAVIDNTILLPVFLPLIAGLILIYAALHSYVFDRISEKAKIIAS
jgi:hypothetical protein